MKKPKAYHFSRPWECMPRGGSGVKTASQFVGSTQKRLVLGVCGRCSENQPHMPGLQRLRHSSACTGRIASNDVGSKIPGSFLPGRGRCSVSDGEWSLQTRPVTTRKPPIVLHVPHERGRVDRNQQQSGRGVPTGVKGGKSRDIPSSTHRRCTQQRPYPRGLQPQSLPLRSLSCSVGRSVRNRCIVPEQQLYASKDVPEGETAVSKNRLKDCTLDHDSCFQRLCIRLHHRDSTVTHWLRALKDRS